MIVNKVNENQNSSTSLIEMKNNTYRSKAQVHKIPFKCPRSKHCKIYFRQLIDIT